MHCLQPRLRLWQRQEAGQWWGGSRGRLCEAAGGGGEGETKLPSPLASHQRGDTAQTSSSSGVGQIPGQTLGAGDSLASTMGGGEIGAAGHVSSTSVFSQERVGFAETQQPFRQSITSTKQVEDDHNPSMRLQNIASATQIGGKHIEPSLPPPDGLTPGDSLVNSVLM